VLPYILDDETLKQKFVNNLKFGVISNKLKLYSYSKAKEMMANRKFDYPYFPCSFVDWDNSPRRGNNGIIIKGSSPKLFAKYLRQLISQFKEMDLSEEENLVMINAWNEWAESNYLEPDKKNGFKYLEALKEVVDETNSL
jgi:hypothetical protein